jgi:hypothetical protein
MPARKAPSASDSPASSDSQASPSVINSTLSMNSSAERRRANTVNQPAHQALAEDQYQRQHQDGLEAAARPRVNSISSAARQRRQQDQQRHHGQILEQQHADHLATVRLNPAPCGRTAVWKGSPWTTWPGCRPARNWPPAQPAEAPDQGDQHDRGQHLGIARARTRCASCCQPGKRELQPDREHQEHHAELGQVAGAGGLGHEVHRVRSAERPTSR